MVNALPKRSVPSSLCIDSAFTDSLGKYRFAGLDKGSFECSSAAIEVEASGYFKQVRYIYLGKDSLLCFSLFPSSGDSTIPVVVMVYTVDTNDHCSGSKYCSPQPLNNCGVGSSNPLTSWWWRVKDTTDQNGKAEFRLSAVPEVDYLISARPLSGSYNQGITTTDISTCMGDNVKIYIHVPRTELMQNHAFTTAALPFECLLNPFHSNMIIRIKGAGPVQQRTISARLYDLKGTLVLDFKDDIAQSAFGHDLSLTWNTNHLPNGMYLLKLNMGNQAFAQKLFLRQ